METPQCICFFSFWLDKKNFTQNELNFHNEQNEFNFHNEL